MPIFTILLVIIIAGVILWVVDRYVPMSPPLKTILYVVVVGVVIFWLLDVFGVIHFLKTAHV